MDKILYLLMNSGSIERIYETQEELTEAYRQAVESEKNYAITHYYYNTDKMTRGEYVCKKLCYKADHWTDEGIKLWKRDGRSVGAYLKEQMALCCPSCPFVEYSPYMGGEQDGDKPKAETN